MASVQFLFGQKVGYMNTQTVLAQIPEYVAATQTLEKLGKQYQDYIEGEKTKIDNAYRKYQADRPRLGESARQTRENEIISMERDLQKKQKEYFGEGGVMSAKSEESDKILGLSIGADDYITKPFHYKEVLARVKSGLRRYMQLGGVNTITQEVRIGRLVFDFNSHILKVDGEAVKLTSTETKIVELLMKHPGRIFSAEEIYTAVWQEPIAYNGEKTVMVHIRRIREKIEINPGEPEYLKVVWGIGYKIEKK